MNDMRAWREDEARDADLLEQRGGVDERHEGLAGGLRHEGERDVAQDEVERVVLDAVAEQEREYAAHAVIMSSGLSADRRRRLRHEGERDVAQDEVERVVLDAVAEQEREYAAHAVIMSSGLSADRRRRVRCGSTGA